MTGQTKIQLTDTATGFLETSSNITFPITFSVSDIRDITKRSGAFSKTIVLPGTKNNNLVLGSYFDVNIQAGTYNVNKIQKCMILQNNVVIMEGAYMQLISVRKKQSTINEDDIIEYSVIIKDSVSLFFGKVGQKELRDLPSGAFAVHNITNFNSQTIISSFENQYSNPLELRYKPYKYWLPWTDSSNYDSQNLEPAIFAKFYWDLIHAAAGFTYTWERLDEQFTRFDKILLTSNTTNVETLAIVNEFNSVLANTATNPNTVLTVNFTPSDEYYSTDSTIVSLFLPNLVDPSGVITVYDDNSVPAVLLPFKTSGYITDYVTTPAPLNWGVIKMQPVNFLYPGAVDITLTIDWSFAIQNIHAVNMESPTSNFGDIRERFEIEFIIENITAGNSQNITRIANIFPSNSIYPANSTTILYSGAQIVTVPMGATSFDIGQEITFYLRVTPRDSVQTGQPDEILKFQQTGTTNPLTAQPIMKINKASLSIKSTVIPTGSTVPLKSYVPAKIKQADFLKTITTMFNLYCTPDINNSNNLIWKKRDKFYDEGEVLNWTEKLNRNEFQEVQFLPELTDKTLIFTYAKPTDTVNIGYIDATKEIYGQQEVTFASEWVKTVGIKELIFPPTPMQPCNSPLNVGWGGICPRFTNFYGASGARLLLDGGLRSSANAYTITDYVFLSLTVSESSNFYPLTTHSNDELNPTYDINFGVCDYYLYDAYTPTANNLYNLNWKRTVNQLDNQKLLEASFYLNQFDIATLNMSSKIRIDNSYWIINKIIDYDANGKQATKVELVSIEDAMVL